MEPISWDEAFSIKGRTLKQYREDNNILVPEEYIISTKRLMVAFVVWSCISSIFIGASIVMFLGT